VAIYKIALISTSNTMLIQYPAMMPQPQRCINHGKIRDPLLQPGVVTHKNHA